MSKYDLVISKDGVKRSLNFPFQICLSREVAYWLRAELIKADNNDFQYGWIQINEIEELNISEGKPREWSE